MINVKKHLKGIQAEADATCKKSIFNRYNLFSKAGFPKLLVHRYPLDTVAGLHVPPKFCDVSLKKRLSVTISH